jgi:uncharacterized protein
MSAINVMSMYKITSLESLLEHHPQAIIYKCIAGSRAYGTASKTSDVDIRGIYILPIQNYLSVDEPIKMVSDVRGDIVYYSLHRFIQLASAANPNIIELLYMPNDCILETTPYMESLVKSRHMFITKMAYDSHIGYALAQIKRARGQNKWINNPQPKEPPQKENFCWLVLKKNNQKNNFPFRPVALANTGMDLSQCHAASLEHVPNVYRLYLIGKKAKGVFRGKEIVCESIEKDEEQYCIGLLIFNRSDYERSLTNFNNYWEWRENRNEQRWLSQESGSLDYDAKNMMHMFRLLLSSESILKKGYPIVCFEGANLEFLLTVLNGNFKYDELMVLANEKIRYLADLYQKSTLPEKPEIETINSLLYEITCAWGKKHE